LVVADIDASVTGGWNLGLGWEPAQFTGSLAGNNKQRITGVKINRPNQDNVALLYGTGGGGLVSTVSRLVFDDATVVGRDAVGVVSANGVTATEVVVFGSVEGRDNVGALIGSGGTGTSQMILTEVTVKGRSNVGGLAGTLSAGTLRRALSLGGVECTGALCGGIVGNGTGVSNVRDVVVSGGVVGTDSVGGVVGVVGQQALVDSVVMKGNVFGSGTNVGGVIGRLIGTGSHLAGDALVSGGGTTSGGVIGLVEATGVLNTSYSRGRNTSATGGAAIGTVNAGATINHTPRAYNPATGQSCLAAGAASCEFVTQGDYRRVQPVRFDDYLRWVKARQQFDGEALRKVGVSDVAAYPVMGTCSIEGATMTATAGTVTAVTSCKNLSWRFNLNLSTLPDGPFTLSVVQNGDASTGRSMVLTKETATCTNAAISATPFAGGNGTSGSPYLVCSEAQFNRISSYQASGVYFRLMNNLDGRLLQMIATFNT